MHQLDRYFEERDLQGLKLAPFYQNLHPMDKRMRPVYEYCEKKYLPILIPLGAAFVSRGRLRYASPVHLEEVAIAYPDLAMAGALPGYPWIEETVVPLRKQPNVHTDLWPFHYWPWQSYKALILTMKFIVAGKLLFGSEFPRTASEQTIAGLRSTVIKGCRLPRVSEQVIESILGRNLFRLGQG